ncbi:MAG: dmeF [Herbaspirillum sp.]|nr:dmeF [Herbaspirillum sp.]
MKQYSAYKNHNKPSSHWASFAQRKTARAMSADQDAAIEHDHVFDVGSHAAERRTRAVMWITAVMMVAEIAAGYWFNSMALLADGWHMSSHALAIGLSAFAYAAARRYARDPRFAFGTWKIEVLAGYTSAIFLLGIAAMMVFGSVERIIAPQAIDYLNAAWVAGIGLAVNIVCALILGGAHHGHDHDGPAGQRDAHAHAHRHSHDRHDHHAHHGHHANATASQARNADLNLKSAYIHVIADAATSVLAIIALLGGWLYGWSWLDPVIGIVGAVLVAAWARRLMADTGKVLLDREMDHPVVAQVRAALETGLSSDTRITDLHIWRVGKQSYSCALSVVTGDRSLTAATLRRHIAACKEIVHTTIEIQFTDR